MDDGRLRQWIEATTAGRIVYRERAAGYLSDESIGRGSHHLEAEMLKLLDQTDLKASGCVGYQGDLV